jgi:endonuclease YncB( thermonuclease family)
MQRTVYIQINDYLLSRNTFEGHVYLKSNVSDSDYALKLLEKGYAFIIPNSNYYDSYHNAEKKA